MTIKKRLFTILGLALLSLVWFAAVSLTLIASTLSGIEKSELTREIIKGAYDLNLLRSDYLRYRETRALEQWKNRHHVLTQTLDRADALLGTAAEKRALEKLKEHSRLMHLYFIKLGAERDKRGENIIAGRLTESSQEFVLTAVKLADQSNLQKISAIKKLIVGIGLFLVNALILLVWARHTVLRKVIRPIEKLQKGVRIVSEGNIGHKISLPAFDELGYLAEEFNKMTSSLDQSYKTLEKQLQTRAEAEQHIRRLNEGLERRVLERTRELQSLNDALRLEMARRERIEGERESFFKLSPDLCFIAGVDGYYKEVNDAFTKTLGYTKEELLAKPVLELVHPEDLAATSLVFERLKDGKPIYFFENRFVAKNGIERWMAWSAASSADNQMIYGVARDVTLLKKDAEKIKEQAELINQSHDAIILRDLRGKITFWNKGAEQLYGWALDDVLGKTTQEIFAPLFSEPLKIIEEQLLETGRWGGELAHLRRDGTKIYVESRWAMLKDSAGKPSSVIEINRDVTHRINVERALASYMEQLRRNNEEMSASNRDLEQFAYAASHDLKEPLRAVTIYLELLEKDYGPGLDADAGIYIEAARKGAVRAQEMIDAMLEFSRVGTKAKAPTMTSMERALDEVRANLKVTIDDHRAVISHDPLPLVPADPFQMLQLLQNFISNAIKFRSEKEPPAVHISAREENGFWIFSVKDNGIGIDPKHQQKIFGLFERLHSESEYPGTGIGLALCKKIVERHGGKIWVESKAGEGACFFFTIPAALEKDDVRALSGTRKSQNTGV